MRAMGPAGDGPETTSGPPGTKKIWNPRGGTLGVQLSEKTGIGAWRSPTQVLIPCPRAGRSPAVAPIPRPRSPVTRRSEKIYHHKKKVGRDCKSKQNRKRVGCEKNDKKKLIIDIGGCDGKKNIIKKIYHHRKARQKWRRKKVAQRKKVMGDSVKNQNKENKKENKSESVLVVRIEKNGGRPQKIKSEAATTNGNKDAMVCPLLCLTNKNKVRVLVKNRDEDVDVEKGRRAEEKKKGKQYRHPYAITKVFFQCVRENIKIGGCLLYTSDAADE